MHSCLFVILLLVCSLRCESVIPPSSLHQLPKDDNMVDARVAELDFTHEFFQNQTQIASDLPCPLPQQNLATFGLGYQSVASEMKTASCWVSQHHRQVGNLDVDSFVRNGAELVHAAGVSELLLASITAAAKLFQRSGYTQKPIVTMHLAPYYAILKIHCQTMMMRNIVEWAEPSSVTTEFLNGRPLIIVAITPSNPGGSTEAGMLEQCHEDLSTNDTYSCFKSPTRVIADHSFMWPCTVRPEIRRSGHWKWPLRPRRDVALLFGLSKLSGHSGVRYGWAWVKNREFAAIMRETLWEIGLSLSASSLAHASYVLAAASQDSFHDWCGSVMTFRWTRLSALPMFSGHCFRLTSEQQSAVTIVSCGEKNNCASVFERQGILVTHGSQFGLNDTYVRMATGIGSSDFEILLSRLKPLRCN